jgi:hypothetical protein
VYQGVVQRVVLADGGAGEGQLHHAGPEGRDFSNTIRDRFYRPADRSVTLRVDAGLAD